MGHSPGREGGGWDAHCFTGYCAKTGIAALCSSVICCNYRLIYLLLFAFLFGTQVPVGRQNFHPAFLPMWGCSANSLPGVSQQYPYLSAHLAVSGNANHTNAHGLILCVCASHLMQECAPLQTKLRMPTCQVVEVCMHHSKARTQHHQHAPSGFG